MESIMGLPPLSHEKEERWRPISLHNPLPCQARSLEGSPQNLARIPQLDVIPFVVAIHAMGQHFKRGIFRTAEESCADRATDPTTPCAHLDGCHTACHSINFWRGPSTAGPAIPGEKRGAAENLKIFRTAVRQLFSGYVEGGPLKGFRHIFKLSLLFHESPLFMLSRPCGHGHCFIIWAPCPARESRHLLGRPTPGKQLPSQLGHRNFRRRAVQSHPPAKRVGKQPSFQSQHSSRRQSELHLPGRNQRQLSIQPKPHTLGKFEWIIYIPNTNPDTRLFFRVNPEQRHRV